MSLVESELHPRGSIGCRYSKQPPRRLLEEAGILAVISFGGECAPGLDPRHYRCGLPQLCDSTVTEVWYTRGDVHAGVSDGIAWSRGDEALFAACWIEDGASSTQAQRVEAVYLRLLDFIARQGYPNIVRMWNYLPGINVGEGDMERYRLFCSGRQQAFERVRYDAVMYPSSCALGHSGGRSVVYLLAAKNPVNAVENPNQVSAYRYPREYGPASPSFARATLVEWAQGRQMYISGTASILGHRSRCVGDLAGQLRITFDNIDTLLELGAGAAGANGRRALSMLKVYVRHPADLVQVQRAVQVHYPGVPAVYLHADICRAELLVEVDGLCELPVADMGAGALGVAVHE